MNDKTKGASAQVELKPCRYCGNKPVGHANAAGFFWYACDCSWSFASKDKAIAMSEWNRRA